MARVELEHVEKIYPNGLQAVADCTLTVEDGELLVFVGPSGCGKSTVLRLVAGLEEVTRGTIRIADRVVNELTPQQRNVAMVFQDYALYPYMTVRGNLEFPLKMRKLPKAQIRQRIEWVAGLLELGELLDRLPRQLSGGQRQRVAMGRALVREPAVFLLDEPLSNLDAKLRVQVRAEISDLQRNTAATMIYVTHDQVEAMTLGGRVAVLDRGELQQVAAPRELYERPANLFVAGFIGSPAMSLFATRLIAGEREQIRFEVGAQTSGLSLAVFDTAEIRRRLGLELTAGVRPEAVSVTLPDGGALRASVEHVEALGHESLVFLRLDGSADRGESIRITARAQGMPGFAKGDAVGVRIDPEQVHLFDENGRSLRARAAGAR